MDKKSRYLKPDTFLDALEVYFENQSHENPSVLGVEMEHLLINRNTCTSYDYAESGGQRAIFEALLSQGWRSILEESGNLLGIEKDGTTLTLEPGGQVEVSLKPLKSIEAIDQAYRSVLEDLYSVMAPEQALVSVGYHPRTKIEALELLPKARYHMMYDYFKTNGRFCHNMMKGTASTQVSIDYADQADFTKKFTVANFLSPVIASIFDATPIFEGSLYPSNNCRISIWEETDIKRSKLIPGAMSGHFGFRDYAAYLLKLPPILLKTNGETVYTENAPLEMLLEKYPMTDADLEHILTMVFPDVRLKKFIEIRMADALPYPLNLGVPALIKAIFYTPELLDYYYEKASDYDDAWVRFQNRRLTQESIPPDADFDAIKWAVLEDAIRVLDAVESQSLKALKEILQVHGSVTAYLRTLYLEDVNEFVKAIEWHPIQVCKCKKRNEGDSNVTSKIS